MANYEKLVSFIIEHVGGKDNIENVTHCMTRLRFKLKDESKVEEKVLTSHKEIVTAQASGGRYQVVIGTHVGDVCEEVLRQLGKSEDAQEEDKDKGSLLNRFTATITQTMAPILGVLGGCGMIAGVMSVLVALNLITSESGTYLILYAMGYACMTFLPILLGYTSAKTFQLNPFVGMILGCILVYPNLTASINSGDILYTIFDGGSLAMPVYKTYFGIPVVFPTQGYTSTVIPIIFATFFASKVERIVDRILPRSAKSYFTPMITVFISGSVTLLLIGPVSIILTNLISSGISLLLAAAPILAYIVFEMVYQPLVILGLHWALISVGIIEFSTTGSTLLLALIFPTCFAHLAVCAAVYLRSKNKKMKETAIPAMISSCFCIIEPSIYGVTLPVKKRFGICMISGTVGAVILGLWNARKYAMTIGVVGFTAFVDNTTGDISGLVKSIVAVVVTMILAFVLTWITYKPEDDNYLGSDSTENKNADRKENIAHKKEFITSPLKGKAMQLKDMKDPAFSSESLGKGVCIVPSEGKLVAPCDGVLSMVFPTGHALGITSDCGAEILIHVGTNTVHLPEGIFHKKKEQGAKVKKGDLLLTFDLEKIIEEGYNTETAVILSNFTDYLDIIELFSEQVTYEDELFATIVTENKIMTAVAQA